MPSNASLPVPLSSSSSSPKERVDHVIGSTTDHCHQAVLVQGHSTSPPHLTSLYVAKLYSPFYSLLPPSLWLAKCHYSYASSNRTYTRNIFA